MNCEFIACLIIRFLNSITKKLSSIISSILEDDAKYLIHYDDIINILKVISKIFKSSFMLEKRSQYTTKKNEFFYLDLAQF